MIFRDKQAPERRALHRERTLQRTAFGYLVEYCMESVCDETTQGQRKNHPKGLRWTVFRAHTGLGKFCSQWSEWKTS